MFNISVLLDVQANLPETSPFFVYPNGFGGHLFSNVYSSTYILGMYNFGSQLKTQKVRFILHTYCPFGSLFRNILVHNMYIPGTAMLWFY